MTATIKKWVAVLPLVAAITTALLFVESKASSTRVEALEARMSASEAREARMDEKLTWIQAGIAAIAARVGAPISVPPTP